MNETGHKLYRGLFFASSEKINRTQKSTICISRTYSLHLKTSREKHNTLHLTWIKLFFDDPTEHYYLHWCQIKWWASITVSSLNTNTWESSAKPCRWSCDNLRCNKRIAYIQINKPTLCEEVCPTIHAYAILYFYWVKSKKCRWSKTAIMHSPFPRSLNWKTMFKLNVLNIRNTKWYN